ncbi:MAG: AMP-dependent synthetase/ligase [Candidatus Magnetoovum sp. WYHC-5]|nr:AMP-dependent synthetase/ligase [Candidatus Magnetoovum sp. WYHC-5]
MAIQNKSFIKEGEILYERALHEPNRVRFFIKDSSNQWQPITWQMFLECSAKIALYFKQIGVGVDTKVAVYAQNMVEWAYFGAAIHANRAVFVPVYISSTPEQVKYILNNSDTEILIIDAKLLIVLFHIWLELPKLRKVIIIGAKNDEDILKELETFGKATGLACSVSTILDKVSFLDNIYKTSKNSLAEDFKTLVDDIKETDVSTILYTSGTTGNPKGVVLTIKNLYSNAGDWINVLSPLIPPDGVDLLWLPFSHIFGWGELGLGNTLGFTSYLTTYLDVLNHMPAIKPTIFISVPAYWEKLYLNAKMSSETKSNQIDKLHELTGGRLKFCLSGGAGLKREIKEFFYDAGLLLIEGYGLTECSPTLTMNSKEAFDFDTVGKPFPSVELKLASDGEILAKGPNVFSQYYKDPISTNEAFDENAWFKTGDIGTFTTEGFLKILGRKKEIIVTSGGKNISPQLIESAFKDDPYIEHIVLYGNERKYITALVTLKNPPNVNDSELIEAPEIIQLVQKSIDKVNQNLASFETIKKFVIFNVHLTPENGFLTASFKLKRNKVYEAFQTVLDKLYNN